MKPIKIIILATAVLGLSACGTTKPVSRNEPATMPLLAPVPATSFNVQDVRVSVPDSLSVSEANVYYPTADIVWREGVYGDRHVQVAAIFDEAMTRGMSALNGKRAIYVDVEVKRFHSLTERARYTVGGVHSILFVLTLRDVRTGTIIGESRLINASLKAFGGKRAVAAEHRGITQKSRITSHLAGVIQREMITQQTNEAVVNLSASIPPEITPNAI